MSIESRANILVYVSEFLIHDETVLRFVRRSCELEVQKY